jgi:hypothetical protein
MISYLESIKSKCEPEIYNRGLRVYLDGAVGRARVMLLDNWRSYVVQDRDYATVKLPLLHLTMDIKKFDKSGDALLESGVCDCEYFGEVGVCKHIVAVCAQIDSEFGVKTETKTIVEVDSILDNIFEADKVKKHRKWLGLVENYFTRENQNYYYLDEISRTVADEAGEHEAFLGDLALYIEPYIGAYSKEKLLVKVILESILVGKKTWWTYWLPYFDRLNELNATKLFVGLWKINWVGSGNDYRDEFYKIIRSQKNTIKKSVFDILKHDFDNQRDVWLEFCFVAHYFDWLEENVDILSPTYLVRLCEILPEKREDYEYKILNQVKTWADFLTAGKYDEITDFFGFWQEHLGRSEVFEDAVKYFRTAHPKKKSLLRKIG